MPEPLPVGQDLQPLTPPEERALNGETVVSVNLGALWRLMRRGSR